MSERILTRREGAVAVVSLARPERKNAVTLDMYEGMTAALAEAREDASVRAVVLRGEGDAFCAGNDLKDFIASPPTDETSPVFRFLREVSTFPKPLVAAVHGAAIGIGTTVLLHCDLVYVAKGTKMRMPFTALALVPEAASSLLIPAMAGRQLASELLMLGDFFSAEQGARVGIVNEVLDDAEATFARAMDRARALAALPPTSIRLTKQLIHRGMAVAVQETIGHEASFFKERLASPELAEAVAAFFDKRAPDFSGF